MSSKRSGSSKRSWSSNRSESYKSSCRRALVFAVGALAAAAMLPGGPTQAQSYSQYVREANENTVSIVAGSPGETSLEIADDLATVLHCVDGLRIVPIVGRGDRNNIYDLLFLRGVDMAIVRADVLDHLSDTQTYTRDLKERIRYIAPLFTQEVHLIANEEIKSIADLNGKLVNIGGPGHLALEATRILDAAGVSVVASKFDSTLALERVIDGGLDAMFITGGKPIPLLKEMAQVSGLHLVPIAPLSSYAVYTPATISYDDYPNLVPPGETVETIAVPSVLAVYNWASDNVRYGKNKVFTEALFRRLNFLRRPARHPKWAGARLQDTVPGWKQFEPAAEIAAAIRAKENTPAGPAIVASVAPVAAGPSEAALEEMFTRQLEEFGITPRSEEERQQLFTAFKRRLEATNR